MTGRIAWIDSLKGIGILFVMLGHVLGARNPLNLYIYSFHIWLFFLICGYLFAPDLSAGFLRFASRRVMTRLVPYAVFYFVSYLFFLAAFSDKTNFTVPEIVAFDGFGPYFGDWITGLLKADRPWLASIRNHTLWFLPCFFLAELLFYAVYRWTGARQLPLVLAAAGSSIAAFLMKESFPAGLWWSADYALKAMTFCCIGALLRTAVPPAAAEALAGRRLFSAGGILLLGAVNIALVFLGADRMEQYAAGRYVQYFVPAVAGGLTWGIIAILMGRGFEGLRYYGRNSIVLLGIHVPLFLLVKPLAARAVRLFTRHDLLAIDLVWIVVVLPPALFLARYIITFIDRHAPWIIGKRAVDPAVR